MLQPATIAFLQKLSKNNNKIWFDKHRDDYVAAKDDHEAHVKNVLDGLLKIEPGLGDLKAKDCIFRIFRDVRFSKDKTPYKTHFGAFFAAGGRKATGAGYYVHVEPGGKSFIGGGLWMPEPPVLKAVRQEIDYNYEEFAAIVKGRKFKNVFGEVQGEQLVKLPQGYEADNPAISYLKLKSFTVSAGLTDADVLGKSAVKKTVETFTIMKPFIDFLNRAIS